MSRKIMLVLAIIVIALVVVPVASAVDSGYVFDSYTYNGHTLEIVVMWHVEYGSPNYGYIDQISAYFPDGASSYVDMCYVETSNGGSSYAGDIDKWHVLTTRYVNGTNFTYWNPSPGRFAWTYEDQGAGIKLKWGSKETYSSQLAYFCPSYAPYRLWR